MQKYVNALSGGQKPNVILQGHYHKAMYMFYRNIHCFDTASMQEQTIFMKKKQTPSMIGYWMTDIKYNKRGIDNLNKTFVPFYE